MKSPSLASLASARAAERGMKSPLLSLTPSWNQPYSTHSYGIRVGSNYGIQSEVIKK